MSIVVGLGGNVGTRAQIIERFRRVREALGGVRSAGLYRSAPLGPEQPEFLNTVMVIEGDWQPRELIALIHELEAQLGRRRSEEVRWGPRTIDIDVLGWDQKTIRTEDLEVPHPRMWDRRFVLEPLAELFPRDEKVRSCLEHLQDQDVALIAPTW